MHTLKKSAPLPLGPLPVSSSPTASQTQATHIAKPVLPAMSLRECLEYRYIANTLRSGEDYGPSFEGSIILYFGERRSPHTFVVRVLVPGNTIDIKIPARDRTGEYDWAPAQQEAEFPSQDQLRGAIASGRFVDSDEARAVHKKARDALKLVMAEYNGASHNDKYKLENLIREYRDKWVNSATFQSRAAMSRLNGPPFSIYLSATTTSWKSSHRGKSQFYHSCEASLTHKPGSALWFDYPDLEPFTYRQTGSDNRPIVTILDCILQKFSATRQVPEAWKGGLELAGGREDLEKAMWPRCEHEGTGGLHICCKCMDVVSCRVSLKDDDGQILCKYCSSGE
ncbi:hypothetical protein PG984_006948 [Apiospora sp. TS-2023a]